MASSRGLINIFMHYLRSPVYEYNITVVVGGKPQSKMRYATSSVPCACYEAISHEYSVASPAVSSTPTLSYFFFIQHARVCNTGRERTKTNSGHGLSEYEYDYGHVVARRVLSYDPD